MHCDGHVMIFQRTVWHDVIGVTNSRDGTIAWIALCYLTIVFAPSSNPFVS